ncbi:MAG: twin-arginine translocase TatA/TatE family subunit [Firmicutes bacterium]|jgi:sec-independent protein translocase protein TatA|uniref:Sec-independent protein translocase protein TatA n=1 Tax=Sulfobacillus benefaciens TaxID=453960 RepID=A0A2T2X2I0_9FIRM|nr:twin-arginine translocase TatA/TatE family subunit [Bacillota bacterium]MCL5015184.1 twin-arginine translocase TatA/TatE family subunit [Bacillota bacterium]PSR28713.1 MAG: twin-arginine translocase TatA/TatE family subunit [Sulfobacillus benefaciens]HBQ96015.1 twin-arginine translocase TatA/TatE family subunit [Sulfobacillus sp.]
MDLLSPMHIIVLLVVALLIFGPKRLPEIGSGLGKSIREFKQSMNNMNNPTVQDSKNPQPTEYPVQAVTKDADATREQ